MYIHMYVFSFWLNMFKSFQDEGSMRVYDSGLAFGSPLNLGNSLIYGDIYSFSIYESCFVICLVQKTSTLGNLLFIRVIN